MAKPKKKPRSPRTTVKKKKTKPQARPIPKKKIAKKKKSKSHLKGWQTRRINALEAAKKTRVKKSNRRLKTHAQKDAEIARLKKEIAERWVHTVGDEYLHADGSLALFPSRLRHRRHKAYAILETNPDKLRELLESAQEIGPISLSRLIKSLVDLTDIPAQEFYTLLMSP